MNHHPEGPAVPRSRHFSLRGTIDAIRMQRSQTAHRRQGHGGDAPGFWLEAKSLEILLSFGSIQTLNNDFAIKLVWQQYGWFNMNT